MDANYLAKIVELKRIATTDSNDVMTDAMILLQFSRNKILHDNIIRKNMKEKLKYEAQKYLDLVCAREGLDPDTLDDGARMDEILKRLPGVEETIAKSEERTLGLRADHDLLPDVVRCIPVKNGELYMRMTQVHEALKNMTQAKDCDRFPYVKELCELEDQIIANWNAYDAYKEGESDGGQDQYVTVDAARISANRKYLSTNKKLLEKAIADKDIDKAEKIRAKMQVRLDELFAVNAGISDDQLTEFSALGLTV